MWEPFIHLALEESVADSRHGTIYSNAYWLLREAIWWWAASVLLAVFFEVVAAMAGDSSRGKSREGIEGKAATIPDLAGG